MNGENRLKSIHRISLCLFLFLTLSQHTFPAIGGSVSGTITDPSGGLVTSAQVKIRNLETAVEFEVSVSSEGTYFFAGLPVGRYDLLVYAPGFRPYRRGNIVLDVNSTVLIDPVLALGQKTDFVTVKDSSVRVETASSQTGDVIKSSSLISLPLNGRSYTDLLALQAGVVPVTTITSLTVQGLGQNVFSPSGDLNPGNLSINGQRESSNGFNINGADAEEKGSMAAGVVPNLDSIAEFRILSSNFGADYGEYTGGQINVITKSGTNKLHGDAFEFLRNTDLDARNFFSPARGTFIQNQFGGTIGGPIRSQKLFFFSDFQGGRQIQGQDTPLIAVPSGQDRSGNLLDQSARMTGSVSGAYWAGLLSQKLGYTVAPKESYYFPGCNSALQCVFPNGTIPRSAWSAPAVALLKYIPAPNFSGNQFATSAFDEFLNDSKLGERVDANTHWGMIFGYYSFDDYTENNPYPTAQGGANVPGFNGRYAGRGQLAVLGDTRSIGGSAVNELRLSYMRDANDLGTPQGGLGVSLASQGFVTGEGTLGIVPLAPSNEGVANIFFNNFTIGSVPDRFYQINNNFSLSDIFSKQIDRHTLKVGMLVEYDQINTAPFADLNGSFDFYGTETGVDFADFLLGVPSQYTQNQLRSFYGRNKTIAPFVEDSWRVRSNLTLNLGLRWDRIEPWYEKYNNNITFVPGRQSIVFPTAPTGIVFPGDPGIPRTLGPAGNHDFSPRLGIAYAPAARVDSLLGKILGGPAKTSIRAGYGIFDASIPGETLGLISDNAPYGFTYTSPAPPLFSTPFVDAATGHAEGQRFPAQLAPLNVSSSNPDRTIDFSQFEPISAIPGYKPDNVIPYTEQYTISLQRQIGASMLLSLDYVGNQAHHLLVLMAANPGNPGLCLSLSSPGQVATNSATCGPFGENGVYTSATGQVFNGTRGPLGPAFGSVSYQTTVGNSSFNALEATLRYSTSKLQLLAAYTYSKSIDQASNLGDQVDPSSPGLSRALSSFDMRNNFVLSYIWSLPVERLVRARNRWSGGWIFSGVTRFSSGLPVTLLNYGDTSLLGTQGNGINNLAVDEVESVPGPLSMNHNPRTGQPYFNAASFSLPALGSIGNTPRRFFSGPGIDNFDLALQKDVHLTEAKSLQFRLEDFNAFNHAQFYGPLSVDGNISSPTFGQVVSAAPPRLMQVVAKFVF